MPLNHIFSSNLHKFGSRINQKGELFKASRKTGFFVLYWFYEFLYFYYFSIMLFLSYFTTNLCKIILYISFLQKKLNRYYIGYTSDIDVRMDFHNNAEVRKFTAKANEWEIVFTLSCETKKQALAIEKHIKAMKSKVYVQNLMKYTDIRDKLLKKYSSVG